MALEAAGYAESEFIVSGQADIYEWSGTAPTTQLTVRTADVPYATRMLLRRPTDRRKFSGMVVVELLDASELYDRAPLWGFPGSSFLRRGDAWVGITVQPAALAALRKFDAVRYASLGFTHRQQCSQAIDDRANPPDTESGLAWGVIAQVGALLRSSSKENPLLDLNPRFLIAAGYAQGGATLTTYANSAHALLRRGDDAPIYDGFLSAAATRFTAPINRCALPPPDEDPRRGALPRDVPFVAVTTEADFNLVPALRRADSDASEDLFRLYEIAGAAPSGPFPAGIPVTPTCRFPRWPCRPRISAPSRAATCRRGWPTTPSGSNTPTGSSPGRPLLSLPRLETLADGGQRRDERGNATGGWRLPQVEVPLARYAGRSTPRDAGNPRATASCRVHRLEAALRAREAEKPVPRPRRLPAPFFRAAVDGAVQARQLVREDGEALKSPQALAIPVF